jgi:hypothetical protein
MKIKELTDAELSSIATILYELEQEIETTFYSNVENEFEYDDAVAEMFNYDNNFIDIELKFGEQTEQYKINRETMELID